MVLQFGIGELSQALKSSFKTKNQWLGYSAEAAVIKLFQKHGWTLEGQRFKTKIAEIDLVFSKDNRVLLVEVKKLNDAWHAFERISSKQQLALKKNHIFLSMKMPRLQFDAYVVWVDRKNKISCVKIE